MKKGILKTTGLLGTGVIAASLVVSCGNKINTNANGDSFDMWKDGKSIISGKWTKFDKIMEKLKEKDVKETKQITNIFNAAVKYLYNQEQKYSEYDKKFREKYIEYQNFSFKPEKIKEKIKTANIKALETEKKIKERVTASFNDSKEAFKSKVGVKWGETAWGAELSRSYEGARNDEEAIENLVVKEMKANAYLRFALKKTTTAFTKGELELGQIKEPQLKLLRNSNDARDRLKAEIAPYFQWLSKLEDEGMIYSSNKNRTLKQLGSSDYITIVSTNSFVSGYIPNPDKKDNWKYYDEDNDFKSPSEIIGGEETSTNNSNANAFNSGYLNKFDPMFISHFLIKAVPDKKNRFKGWEIKMPDLKKLLYSTDGMSTISENISGFQGVKNTDTSGGFKWEVDKNDKRMIELVSGNSAAKTTGGSLGLQDELEYVQGMTHGFAIPILNKNAKGEEMFDTKPNTAFGGESPIKKLSIKLLNVLQKLNGEKESQDSAEFANAAGIQPTDKPHEKAIKWGDHVDKLASTLNEKDILDAIGRKFKDIFGDAGEFRSAIYEGEKGNKIVLSRFGIHIIKINKMKHKIGTKDAINELKSMIKSDLTREKDGESPFFNVLKELNKYSSDEFLIVKSLRHDKKFLEFLKKQKNYSADPIGKDKNDFPVYDTNPNSEDLKNIDKALDAYKQIFNETRAQKAIEEHRKFIQDNWFKNDLINPGSTITGDRWTKSVNQIYDNALEVAAEGLVK